MGWMTKRTIHLTAAIWLISGCGWAGERIHMKTRYLTQNSYPAVEALTTGGQRGHLLVQFAKTPGADTLRELRRRGARIVGAAPDGGLTISASRPVSLDQLGIEWAGPLLAEDKISPVLAGGAEAAAVLVEFHPDVRLRRALALLRARHVEVLRHPDLAPNHVLISAAPAVLADLAGLDEVAYIFPASQDLIQGNRVKACAGPLTAQGAVGQYITVGSGWGGAGTDGVVELEYFFAQMSAKLPTASAQSEIVRAFEEWAKHAKLRLVAGAGAAGNHAISVLFAQGAHGDGYPFSRQVLAHTFFPAPPNPEPIGGDMHFNEDQGWHLGADIDLYTVALHEAGHALGLGHTDQPDDVMYPYYRMGKVLSNDDIAGIQALYGSPDTPPSPPPAPPVPPVSLTISTPATAAVTTTAAAIALAGTASGGAGTLQITWSTDRGGAGLGSGSANWSISAASLSLGANRITVQATDTEGHTAAAVITVTRQSVPPPPPPTTPPVIPPAGGPPSLTIVSPYMTVVATSLATITFSGTASASVTAVKWTNSTGASGDAAGTTSWTAVDIPLLVGTNTITVQGFDASGNCAWRAVTVVRR